jgi:hypothetical protein
MCPHPVGEQPAPVPIHLAQRHFPGPRPPIVVEEVWCVRKLPGEPVENVEPGAFGRTIRTYRRLPSAFREMDPIPQFNTTPRLGKFLEARFSQGF